MKTVPDVKSINSVCICCRLSRCELTEEVFRALGSVLTSGGSRLTSLSVGANNVGDSAAKHMWEALRHKNCKLQHLK